MDSFFSLFDPSEGGTKQTKKKLRPEQDNVKKKEDGPKGRRRGRKANGKNETLPEESSFLCEPELSTELLVKDGSYIESYFEVNKKDDDNKDQKPKRRNSGRKCRRKKNKISPEKDLQVSQAWSEQDTTSWNNQSSIPRISDENIGKNVNDLTQNDSKTNNKNGGFDENVYKVINKLEKVGLKDDTYLAGDFNTEELEDDRFYSSDDLDDSFDDSASELDDSGEEAYGSLPPEPRFGNVEYKLQLVSPCERRFQHLVTQLKWRLRSGGGACVYVVGVRDCGALRGLRARALRASLHALRRMARALAATLAHVTARRVAPDRAVAEVYITKLADAHQSVELRVAVMGANEAGKSTLIGVLTQGELDNGRGSARLNMFRHLHEVKSGRTSSLSHEILGFDAQGNVVNYGCSELMTAERIGERSAKLVSFLDLAGHSKYQRTTLHGLSGYCPHRAMLVISATAGISRITEEHLALLLALNLPFFCVISKCDIAPAHPLLRRLQELLLPRDKKPVLITDENMARSCVAPPKLILDAIDRDGEEEEKQREEDSSMEQVPVFPVSCVRGSGLNALHAYLLALQPPHDTQSTDNESCEFQVDEIFHVGDSAGPVVGGLMARGQLLEGDNLIIGPFETGEFADISVRTIHRNRSRCGGVRAGQCASLGLSRALALRPGMVLLARPPPSARGGSAAFGACAGACKNKDEATDIVLSHQQDSLNKKNVRRKNKNLLQDIANVKSSLTKTIDNEQNIYKSDGEGKDKIEDRSNSDVEKDKMKDVKQECVCRDVVLLEDPSNPRGCIFFQASVHILRHSTAICRGFQCTVHVGNVRQTAIIEGILSRNGEVRAGMAASLVFRFTRFPEFLVTGRRLLLTAGQGTRGIGRVTQVFPFVP